ncbi:MAG: hypothetical protein EX285_00785 [Thaumarchaeota archaeon]|nr:hypothetical protein [Nitrososphaerota archaeon]
MGVLFEVIRYKIITNSLLPMVRVRLRVTNDTGTLFRAGVVICDVYLGKSESQGGDLPYITSSLSVSDDWVNVGNSFEVQANIVFTQETLYKLDKLISLQEDLRLNLHAQVQIFNLDQQNKIEQTSTERSICNFEIKTSDWAKIAYEWGKEIVLVPMSPNTYERIREILKTSKRLKNIDEAINELMEMHSNQS